MKKRERSQAYLMQTRPAQARPTYGQFLIKRSGVYLLGLVIVGVVAYGLGRYLGCDMGKFSQNAPLAFKFLSRFLSPDWSFFPKILPALGETLVLACASAATGLFFAIPLSLIMAHKSSPSVSISRVVSALAACLRTIPSLVWAALLVSLFSVGSLSGFCALTIIMTLQASKLLREHIDSLPSHLFESLQALGAGSLVTMKNGLLPVLSEKIASIALILFESGVRGASVLGLVGAGGIGQLLSVQLAYLRYDRLALIILTLFCFVLLCDCVSQFTRHRLSQTRHHEGLAPVSEDVQSGGVGAEGLETGGFQVNAGEDVRSQSGDAQQASNTLLAVTKDPIRVRSYRHLILKKVATHLLVILAIVGGCALFVSLSLPEYERIIKGVHQLSALAHGLAHPDVSYLSTMAVGLVESLAMAVLATMLGGICAVLLTSCATTLGLKSAHRLSVWPARIIANACRSFPSIILAIIFLVMLGPGPFSGVMALIVYTTGVMTRYLSESFDSQTLTHAQALEVLGVSRARLYWTLVVREYQTFMAGLGLYRLESNIRNAAILGMVGAGGMGALLENNIKYRNWDRVSILLLGLMVASVVFDALSLSIRKRID